MLPCHLQNKVPAYRCGLQCLRDPVAASFWEFTFTCAAPFGVPQPRLLFHIMCLCSGCFLSFIFSSVTFFLHFCSLLTLIYLLPWFSLDIISWTPGWSGTSLGFRVSITVLEIILECSHWMPASPMRSQAFQGLRLPLSLFVSQEPDSARGAWVFSMHAELRRSWEVLFLHCIYLQPEWTVAPWIISGKGPPRCFWSKVFGEGTLYPWKISLAFFFLFWFDLRKQRSTCQVS